MNHLDIVQQLATKFPELLAGINDDARREFTRRTAQTLKARYPEEGWAHKSASPDRPPSKDAVVDKDMRYYDILSGAGTASPTPCWVTGDLIPDQHRIDVEAFDWLAGTPDPPPAPPDPGNWDEKLDEILMLCREIRQHFA